MAVVCQDLFFFTNQVEKKQFKNTITLNNTAYRSGTLINTISRKKKKKLEQMKKRNCFVILFYSSN